MVLTSRYGASWYVNSRYLACGDVIRISPEESNETIMAGAYLRWRWRRHAPLLRNGYLARICIWLFCISDLYAMYNCTYCQEDIPSLRVKCIECPEFDLCLQVSERSNTRFWSRDHPHFYLIFRLLSFLIFILSSSFPLFVNCSSLAVILLAWPNLRMYLLLCSATSLTSFPPSPQFLPSSLNEAANRWSTWKYWRIF